MWGGDILIIGVLMDRKLDTLVVANVTDTSTVSWLLINP